MTASILAAAAYLLILFCYFFTLLLCLEWFFHALPGAGLNPLRRTLFLAVFPLLSFSERYFSIDHGRFHSRGLLLAVLLMVLGRYAAPWLVLASYGLRG